MLNYRPFFIVTKTNFNMNEDIFLQVLSNSSILSHTVSQS